MVNWTVVLGASVHYSTDYWEEDHLERMDKFIIRNAVFKVMKHLISTIIIGSQVKADFRLFIHILISWCLVISEGRQVSMVLSNGQVNI